MINFHVEQTKAGVSKSDFTRISSLPNLDLIKSAREATLVASTALFS